MKTNDHPPKGETPSEAETIRELREDLAIREDALVAALAARNAIEKAARDLVTWIDSLEASKSGSRVVAFAYLFEWRDRLRASLSSLPQEGAAGEGGAGHG